MSRFIETIKIQNGKAANLGLHNDRLNRTRHHFYGIQKEQDIAETISKIAEFDPAKIYRLTILYNREIEDYRFIEYNVPAIQSLKIVHDNQINYSFKFADRSNLDKLYDKRENCDNILIVKDGMLTDSLYANIAFYDGKEWLTPDTPLLKGTKRSLLLKEYKIHEQRINEKDIHNFESLCLINAMLDLNQCLVQTENLR